MSLIVSQTGPAGRVGEWALWGVAGLVMLTVHFGAAAYLLREEPDAAAENAPPAAIMIELAAVPEAANTEEEQISTDMLDQQEVKTNQLEPVEEPIEQPEPEPEPVAEPLPEPVEPTPPEVAEPVEPTPPEPVIEEPAPQEPVPMPEMAEPLPEPPPELFEEVDPLEQRMTAALENVEVPLPMARPELPVEKEEAKKPEPKKEQPRTARRAKQQQQQAREERAQAKIEASQSDRTAASQTSTGSIAPSVSPARWKSRVQAKIARNARRCPGDGTGTAAVRFNFDGRGNVTGVSLSRSSGDSAIDNYIVAAVRRASPIPAPPSGVASYLDQALTCQ